MFAWRITRAAHQALDGEGARLYGGRWNSEGGAVVYLASTLSLAAIEYLVHVSVEDVPPDLVAMRVDLPHDAEMEEVELTRLPRGWQETPDAPECLAIGDDWCRRGASLLLRVPSAVIPEEYNLLLNPAHPDARRVVVGASRPFRFDRRLVE